LQSQKLNQKEKKSKKQNQKEKKSLIMLNSIFYTNQFENTTFRCVLLYIYTKLLSAKQVFLNCSFQEYVTVDIQGENEKLLICNVYRYINADNSAHMFNFINCLTKSASDDWFCWEILILEILIGIIR